MLIKHCYLMGKNPVLSSSLKNVICTLLDGKHRFAGGMLILKAVALIQKMQNSRVAQMMQ